MTWLLFCELLAKSSVIAGAGLTLSLLLRRRSASDHATLLRAAVCLLLADGTVLDVYDVQQPVPGLFVHRAAVVDGEATVGSAI